MISGVQLDSFTPALPPNKFEAGTPNIAGAIGLKAAIDFIGKTGFSAIQKAEKSLTEHLLSGLSQMPFIRPIGPTGSEKRGPIISFAMDGVHPHDIAEGLSNQNICIRAGYHCAQPFMDDLGIPGTARISLAPYNTDDEIDRCCEALKEIYEYFN